MPIMIEDDELRVAAGMTAALTGADAFMNDELEVLDNAIVDTPQGKVPWTKIRLFAVDQSPEGWVRSAHVDLTHAAADGPIDKLTFARQCWVEALFSDANPHYVAAVAEMRSATASGQQAGNLGPFFAPFLFTQAEWDASRVVPDFALSTYGSRDIMNWRMQVVLFTLMTHRTEQALTTALNAISAGRLPSAAELYLAQLIGPKAAAAAVTTVPAPTIQAAFNAVSAADQAADRPLGAPTLDKILGRFSELLGDGSVKGDAAIDAIVARLDPVLVTTKDNVVEAGTELLGAVSAPPTSTLNGADTPLPAQPGPANVTTVPPPDHGLGNAPNAGGILGKLISRGEGDYGTFNRGNASDSGHEKIDFSQMTIQQIRDQQSLPPGNSNRLFAVGKYQLIPATLSSCVQTLGIGMAQNFTPQIQERCFRDYLIAAKRPKVKAYITGASNDLAGTQLALAQEFASVADPTTGRSFYSGMGGNKASISAQEIATALNNERVVYQQNLATMNAQAAWEALSPGM